MVGIGEIAVLAALEQSGKLRVQRIQRGHVVRELVGYARIAAFVRRSLERGQFIAGGGRQALEGFRPCGYNLVAFLLAVCPDLDQPVQPFLRGLRLPHKVAFAHAEKGQAFAFAVEGFGGGVLPLLRGFVHALQRLAGLLRAGEVVHQRDRVRHHSRGDRQPHRRGLAQHRKESRPAAARLAHGSGKLANAGGERADALGHLAQGKEHRPRGRGIGGHADDLHPLGLVHVEEAFHEVARAVDEALNRGIQVVAELLGEEKRRVFEVDEPAFRGGVALARFLGEGGVLLPGVDGHVLRPGEQLVGVDRAQERIAQADLRDADIVQCGDGRNAFLVHPGKARDKRLKRRGGVGFKERLEALRRQAGHAGEVLQRLAAGGRSHLHLDQRLGKRRAAHFGLDTDRRQRRGKAQNLRLGQPHLMARRRQTQRHLHDGGFRGGKLVAQIHQRRAQIAKQALVHVRDVGKLRQRRCGLVGHDVRGITQVDHGAGEVRQIVLVDAQLARGSHDLVDLAGGRGNLRGHGLGGRGQRVKFRLGGVHGLAHAGEGGLKVQRRLDGRRAQR